MPERNDLKIEQLAAAAEITISIIEKHPTFSGAVVISSEAQATRMGTYAANIFNEIYKAVKT